MKFLLETAKRGRTLAVQLAFVVLALAILALLSYRFMVSTVQESIVRHTDSVMDSTEEWIAATTLEFETTLDVFAEEIRAMLLRGDAAGELWDYVESTAQFTFLDGKSKAGIEDFYGYFEALPGGPAFIHSSAFNLPAIYRPRQENWYRAAVAAGGERAQTAPFIDAEGQIKYTYSKCIFDENGQSLGVVCLRVGIDMLGQRILRTAKEQGGYGILINQNGLVLYHPNEAFVGRYIRDYRIPLSELAEEIHSGVEIFERPMISYNGEPSVSFFRTQANGWHLGLVMPEVQYYGNTSRMGWIMALISVGIGLVLMLLLIRLDMARKKSDDESKRKSIFLANMSHEIRTPINAIVGMSAIGKAADVSERKDYCFDKIDDASRHLLGVVNDILDMSKIEADKIELPPTDHGFCL